MSDPRFGPLPEAPKRFYERAAAEEGADGFAILLDGRAAKTPARNPLAAPTRALGEAVAAEWARQGERIDRLAMPLTRLLATALDNGVADRAAWIDIVAGYLRTDLVCYRAEGPAGLVDRQNAVWTPFLDRFAERFGVRLALAAGVVAVDQPPEAEAAVRRHADSRSVHGLVALKAACEVSGSAVLALAATESGGGAGDAFAACRVDERFQAEQWGDDAEALARERAMEREFQAAARYAALTD